jgi:hypothetical protein
MGNYFLTQAPSPKVCSNYTRDAQSGIGTVANVSLWPGIPRSLTPVCPWASRQVPPHLLHAIGNVPSQILG